MKHSLISAIALIALSVGARNAQAQPVTIDFESAKVGASAEGLGAVHPLLNINASNGQATVIGERDNKPFVAYATSGSQIPHGCLGNPGGFKRDGKSVYGRGFADDQKKNDFIFTFKPNTTVTKFSILMLDFGDLNPSHATQHEVEMVAFDAKGTQVDKKVLSFNTAAVDNPPAYSEAGDACLAQPGQPGNYTFTVSGQGITKVRLHPVSGIDPNVAFDNISFTACTDTDGDKVCDNDDRCPNTKLPEAFPNPAPNHYADLDGDGVFDSKPPRQPPYTLKDTHGCTCTQILDALGKEGGNRKHGCPEGIMSGWIARPAAAPNAQ